CGAYEAACARAGVVDFAELLLRAFELWRDNAELLAHYRQRFRHVLVDEFQDTNAIQYEWIKQLAAPGPMAAAVQHAASAPSGAAAAASCPFVVGDDDQCLAAGTLVALADGAKRTHAHAVYALRTVNLLYAGAHALCRLSSR